MHPFLFGCLEPSTDVDVYKCEARTREGMFHTPSRCDDQLVNTSPSMSYCRWCRWGCPLMSPLSSRWCSPGLTSRWWHITTWLSSYRWWLLSPRWLQWAPPCWWWYRMRCLCHRLRCRAQTSWCLHMIPRLPPYTWWSLSHRWCCRAQRWSGWGS